MYYLTEADEKLKTIIMHPQCAELSFCTKKRCSVVRGEDKKYSCPIGVSESPLWFLTSTTRGSNIVGQNKHCKISVCQYHSL